MGPGVIVEEVGFEPESLLGKGEIGIEFDFLVVSDDEGERRELGENVGARGQCGGPDGVVR
jgi:hypothetical protein